MRLSPMHDLMVERGAVMGAAHGWERPNWFTDTPGAEPEETFRRANWFHAVAAEVDAATNRVAMADLSVQAHPEFEKSYEVALLDLFGGSVIPPDVTEAAYASLEHDDSDQFMASSWVSRFFLNAQSVPAASNS